MQVKHKNVTFYRLLFSLKFVSSAPASITSSQIIAELLIILAKYFSFSQLRVAGFQT